MVDIIHRVGIEAPAARVRQALTSVEGLAGWWTQEVHGDGAVGSRLEFVFRHDDGEVKGRMVMEVQQPDADADVRWRCVDGPPEWIDTDITYRLTQQDGQTIVLFGHRNWREAVEFTSHCSMKWATFLLSLRDYVLTGEGRPAPRDVKIDNWN
ncbi:MAG: SRPBCC family protein [Longimicrobiales bacterium]